MMNSSSRRKSCRCEKDNILLDITGPSSHAADVGHEFTQARSEESQPHPCHLSCNIHQASRTKGNTTAPSDLLDTKEEEFLSTLNTKNKFLEEDIMFTCAATPDTGDDYLPSLQKVPMVSGSVGNSTQSSNCLQAFLSSNNELQPLPCFHSTSNADCNEIQFQSIFDNDEVMAILMGGDFHSFSTATIQQQEEETRGEGVLSSTCSKKKNDIKHVDYILRLLIGGDKEDIQPEPGSLDSETSASSSGASTYSIAKTTKEEPTVSEKKYEEIPQIPQLSLAPTAKTQAQTETDTDTDAQSLQFPEYFNLLPQPARYSTIMGTGLDSPQSGTNNSDVFFLNNDFRNNCHGFHTEAKLKGSSSLNSVFKDDTSALKLCQIYEDDQKRNRNASILQEPNSLNRGDNQKENHGKKYKMKANHDVHDVETCSKLHAGTNSSSVKRKWDTTTNEEDVASIKATGNTMSNESVPEKKQRRGRKKADHFDKRFDELVKFKEIHGHCTIPSQYEDYPELGEWCMATRKAFNKMLRDKGPLTDQLKDRVDRLKKVGFHLDHNTASNACFERRCVELAEFRLKFGHSNVPAKYEDNERLAKWCSKVRSALRQIEKGHKSRYNLSPEMIHRLEDLDFDWKLNHGSVIFEKRCNEFVAFQEKYGHANIPKRFDENPSLGRWCGNIRSAYRKIQSGQKPTYNITKERIEILNKIGFKWKAEDR